jgi:hypothetical protein
MHTRPALLSTTLAAGLLTGCAHVATVQGPDGHARLATPRPVTVTLGDAADPPTFRATVNGTDITEHFEEDDGQAKLTGYVFEPAPGRQPHRLTVSAQPRLNEKGRPVASPFEQTLTFYPPTPSLQGNVGLGDTSRVELAAAGRASVMLRLPQNVAAPTTFTVRPLPAPEARAMGLSPDDMLHCVQLNGDAAGEPIEVTVDAGRRVAVFEIDGRRPGVTTLRAEAPGYVAAHIDVHIQPAPATAGVSIY